MTTPLSSSASVSTPASAAAHGGVGWRMRYGPWAIVTGASDGIGRAFAVELARRGLHLVLVARNAAALDALADALGRDHPVACRVLPLDLGEPAAVARLQAETADLDIGLVVAAAGFGSLGALLDLPLERERAMLRLNVETTLELAHRFGAGLRARGRGGLVLFGSVLGFQGVPLSANYAAGKGYVQSLAEALRLEWRAHGVDVISCAPGPVRTGFGRRAGMRMGAAATPEAMVAPTLDALGRAATVRPGGLSKLLGWSLATLPRALRTRVLAGVMRGMRPAADA
jgi:hypothetical protein